MSSSRSVQRLIDGHNKEGREGEGEREREREREKEWLRGAVIKERVLIG
jgi:hypothetical protein